MKHFLRYVDSQYEEKRAETAYRIYVTDAIRLMGKINIRYADLLDKRKAKEPQESAEEIKTRILDKLKGG